MIVPFFLVVGMVCAGMAAYQFRGAWREISTGVQDPFLVLGLPTFSRRRNPRLFVLRRYVILLSATLATFFALFGLGFGLGLIPHS